MSFIKSLTQFKSDFEQPFISKNTSIVLFVPSCAQLWNKQNVQHFINSSDVLHITAKLAKKQTVGDASFAPGLQTQGGECEHRCNSWWSRDKNRLGHHLLDMIMTTIYWVSPRLTDEVGLARCSVKEFQICRSMQTFFLFRTPL